MKRIYLLISLLCLFVMSSRAQLLYEPFNYTPHATLGLSVQSGVAWQIVNTGDSILVEAGSLSYAGLAASTGNKVKFDDAGTDYYRIFTAQTSGSVYTSFILNVTGLGGMTTAGGSYFSGLNQTGSTTAFGATVFTRLSATAGRYNVGIATRSNSTVSWLAADLVPGTSVFIVTAYDIIGGTANDVARIWLNTSAIGAAEPGADATAAPGTDLSGGVERTFLRQANAAGTPFIQFDELRVGTSWTSVTPAGVAAPALSISTTLPTFGNQCINTTGGPNSFTISGTNLTNADVTVAALAGFTYSTTSGGTYTSTLTLPQAGGAFSQQVFVKFDPTAVQSYNGNIVVAGGGAAASVNAAATGAGINNAPAVTSGSASAITTTSATVAGSISATGCSAVTAYGIEWSTTAGFPNGSGTQVPASNLSAGNFSSDLTTLSPATTYYYHAYATNAGGTAYGAEQSFTTISLTPTISTTPLTGFGNICINTTGGPNSFTITGTNLSAANVDIAALTGYTYSTTSGGTYTATLSFPQAGGAFTQTVYVKFDPVAVQSYNGNITITGGGIASPIDVVTVGAGINTLATVTTGASNTITATTAISAGTISANGCSAVTAYGIEWSTTAGFPNGSGTQVPSTNIAGGSFTSSLIGLTPATTYYYHAYATNAGGTAYGAEQSFTTASLAPAIIAGTLTAFGNVCINTTTAANSFTLTGTNLTTADVTVAALAGYTYSTTSGGTYTSTLTIPQAGGAFTQTVYVKFTPTAVQSYNGNIVVNGGGLAAPVNVAASGTGINTMASVTTGASSAVTTTTATLAGSITATGCSAVTVYGIEYSTTNNFPTGTGTQAISTNLAGGNFSSNLTLLTASTTYYYRAYATNAGGTVYGAQQSFTTATPPPPALTATTLAAIGPVCINSPSVAAIFTINGTNLTTAPITVGPLAGYTFMENGVGAPVATLTINQTGGTQSKNVHVILFPTAVQSYNGNIPVTGGGTTGTLTVPVTGSGINTVATITTNAATNITTSSAVVSGTLVNINCSNITTRGIEFSGINGFANGTGTPVLATGAGFSVTLTGLVPNTTYYYKAFGDNNGGRGYGAQQSFTTLPIGDGFRIFPSPVTAGSDITVTANNLKPGYYGVLFFNSGGQLVLQKNIHVQNNYINQTILIPGSIGKGVYRVHFVNNDEVIEQRSILVR